VIVELVNTGSELMLGRVLNSHQQWLCRQLADRGYRVGRQVAVADGALEIELAVREALSRADLVLTTGGLGPTSDDLTRDSIARLLGRQLREDAETLAHIQAFFARRNRPMPERTRLEAQVPLGASILPNLHGTAPGLAIEVSPNPFRDQGRGSWLIMLPGPARELRPLFTNFVVPFLQRAVPLPEPFVCCTLRTVGLGESVVQERIGEALGGLVSAGLEVGYCARPGQVDVRLAATGDSAAKLVAEAEAVVQERLGPEIFGIDDEELEEVVIRLLAERGQTLAVAESCTGGCLADRLTNVPGASAVLRAGLVTYSNEAKQAVLGVRAETLDRHGAVSEAVASEMAEGARRVSRADYAIATTGIAGPAGGTPEKPVGTVFIAVASSQGTEVKKMFNAWDRRTFKEVTVRQALDQLRLWLPHK
jgi:competence/damage-inducible protein CinA-like protein